MTISSSAGAATHSPALHRLVFRLHFYAGVIVAPFVFILALSGIVYLFNTEIEDALHPEWRFSSEAGEHLPPDEMIGRALAAYPGARATRLDLPTEPGRTATLFLTPETGEPFRAYVEPATGAIKGDFIYENTLVGVADAAHGSLLMDGLGRTIVELAACWAVLLVATGIYLWWPRGTAGLGGILYPRLDLRGRALWRDVHAVSGMWTSVGLLFLLLTGLPWSDVWGANLNRVMAAAGMGYPAAYRTHIGEHGATPGPETAAILAEANPGIAWTLEQAPAPHSHSAHSGPPIDVATAARQFEAAGLTTAYRLVYPRNEHDVFTAYTYPDQPEGQRTIHVDQYTGQIVNDVSFQDYGSGAQAVELGVQIHMGNYFGLPNQAIMLAASFGAMTLSISGPVMWLKRRRTQLGAPPPYKGKAAGWMFYGLMAVFGVIFPLLGITVVLVLAIERLVLSRIETTRQWLGLSA